MQDDWRVSDKLTLNYGIRLEHESGLAEADNKLVVGFDRDHGQPARTSPSPRLDPLAGTPARQVRGGLIYAGQNGANEHDRQPAGDQVVAARRRRLQHERRRRWCAAATACSGRRGHTAPTTRSGYSPTTTLQQDTTIPITTIDNPFPTA